MEDSDNLGKLLKFTRSASRHLAVTMKKIRHERAVLNGDYTASAIVAGIIEESAEVSDAGLTAALDLLDASDDREVDFGHIVYETLDVLGYAEVLIGRIDYLLSHDDIFFEDGTAERADAESCVVVAASILSSFASWIDAKTDRDQAKGLPLTVGYVNDVARELATLSSALVDKITG